MPGMDGIEASKLMKSHKSLSKIPAIVMVTAYGREEVMQQTEDVGLEGFLLKPVTPSMLFDTTMQAFGEEVPEISGVAQRNAQEGEGLENIQGAQVLLVEDNEINQQVAKEIREALEKKDQLLAVRLAHTVKGVAGTLGADALAKVAGEVEKELKGDETGELSHKLGQFESHLNQVMRSIEKSEAGKKEKIENSESSGRDPVISEVVGPIITDLFDLLETDLVGACSRLEDLAGHLANSKLGEQFKMLEHQMDIFNLKVGQTLFLYTDGVTEAMSPGNELFGLDRLQGLLKRKHDFKLDKLCSDIEISLSEFQEGQQFDDITMLALKRIM